MLALLTSVMTIEHDAVAKVESLYCKLTTLQHETT